MKNNIPNLNYRDTTSPMEVAPHILNITCELSIENWVSQHILIKSIVYLFILEYLKDGLKGGLEGQCIKVANFSIRVPHRLSPLEMKLEELTTLKPNNKLIHFCNVLLFIYV